MITRRDLLKTSGLLTATSYNHILGANGRIRVGMIGPGNQGINLFKGCLSNPRLEVVAVSDVFKPILDRAVTVAQKIGKQITPYADFREVLTRKDIDAVVIATPDHWHAYMTVEACKNGKDVYVEKPISVDIYESQQMVAAARKYNRVVQVGTQQRSSGIFQNAVKIIQAGTLGRILMARTWITGDSPIGSPPDSAPPPGLDWEMWQGPAQRRPFNMNRCGILLNSDNTPAFNKDGNLTRWSTFRVFWDYAGGSMTDWGVHLLDIVLWATNKRGPISVSAEGGIKYVHMIGKDNRETPDTIVAVFDFGEFLCEFYHGPVGGLKTWTPRIDGRGRDHGILFEGEGGRLFVNRFGWAVDPAENHKIKPPIVDGQLIPLEGTLEKHDNTGVNHLDDWINCMESRERPASDIETGHLATVTCHLGNIAYRSERLVWDPQNENIVGNQKGLGELLRHPYRNGWKLKV